MAALRFFLPGPHFCLDMQLFRGTGVWSELLLLDVLEKVVKTWDWKLCVFYNSFLWYLYNWFWIICFLENSLNTNNLVSNPSSKIQAG